MSTAASDNGDEPLLNYSTLRAQPRLSPTVATTSIKPGHTRSTLGVEAKHAALWVSRLRPSFLLTPLSLSVALNLLLVVLVVSGAVLRLSSSANAPVTPAPCPTPASTPFTIYPSSVTATPAAETLQAESSPYDTTSPVAWQRPLRQPAASRVLQPQQHTAVCVNFNRPPMLESLATILSIHSRLHRHLTIVSPVAWHELPTPLPAGVRYIKCTQESILLEDDPAQPLNAKGWHGVLQHICAAACFDYYATAVPQLRGVIWQADDMFVNYTALFSEYPSNKSWSPSHSHVSVLHLTEEIMPGTADWWTTTPIGNLYAARKAIQLLQTNPLYRQAWPLAFGSIENMAAKALSDFFYLPYYQLRTYVDITTFMRNAAEQYVTVPDTANSSRTVTVRVGMTMCEYWTATQVRLTAAIHALQVDPHSSYTNCQLSEQLVHIRKAEAYVWGAERDNYTRLHEYCFQTRNASYRGPAVTVHPLKLSVAEHRRIYMDAYKNVQETW